MPQNNKSLLCSFAELVLEKELVAQTDFPLNLLLQKLITMHREGVAAQLPQVEIRTQFIKFLTRYFGVSSACEIADYYLDHLFGTYGSKLISGTLKVQAIEIFKIKILGAKMPV